MPTKIFPAQFEHLDAIREFAAEAARQAAMDDKEIYNMQLAVDEAASNIIEHAYENIPDGQIEISIEVTPEALTVIMRDHGKYFNPDETVEPDPEADLEDRAIGGLGLFFMRKLMDEVRFEWQPEQGNLLTLVKLRASKQKPAKKNIKSKNRSGYNDMFDLGEKILAASSFAAQRDLIIETAALLVDGQITLWLNESAFHLPNWVENLFPAEPPTPFLKHTHETGRMSRKHEAEAYWVAVPIRHEEVKLGAIEIYRPNGGKFSRRELDFLDGLGRTTSIALVAWHRVNVERWRLGQLSLVRTVSAQIANEPDIDVLADKVTRLIQATFKYYYVGIFTLEAGRSALTFRSSAGGATRHTGSLTTTAFQVNLGEGLVGHAAQTGEELLANDARSEQHFRPVNSLPETRSELALPLRIEERVVGVLDVQSDALNAFHPHDMLVLRALADSVAMAIEGAKLYGDLHRQANQLRVVAEVSKQITSILSLRELMQEVAELISTRFNFPYVHLFTVHPNRRQIHYEAGSGARSAALEGYILNLDDAEGIIPWVAQHGEPIRANNVEAEPRYIPSPLPPSNTHSELTVPLVFNGHVNGVLDVQSDQFNAFTEQDQLIIETLGDSIAAAIRNADLYRSEQWRRQTGDSLREVAVLLSANASLDQVLQAVLTELERNLPSDIAAIWLLDEDDIYCAAVHGARASDLEQAREIYPEATGMLATALLSRQPFIRKPADPMGPSALSAGFDRDHSAIAVPLRIGDQSVGVLTLAHHTPGRYGHEAQAMATTFASYAAVAIENARLYDSAQEQAYASAALLQVAQAVVSLSDITDILSTIVRIMPILVGVERAAIFSWDATTGTLIPAQEYGIPAELRPTLWRLFSAGEFPLLDAAVEQGKMVMCQDAHLGPENWLSICPCSPEDLETVTHSDNRLMAALPLMLKGETFGVLLVEEAIGGRRFRNRRLEILNGVAQQVALAFQNDIFQQERVSRDRLETEVQLARQIQETFIPKTLNAPQGWDLAARWRTALQMGGDFYDVINLADGRLGIFIADVADKGIPAALFMALTRTLMRAAILQTDSPAEALRQVNDLLYPDCEQGMFVTAVYGALDPKTGIFTYANAGHNPPLWVHSGQIDLLTRTGIALGVIEYAQMAERCINLAAGDLLMFYTDGITEAFSAHGEIFGDERLRHLISKLDVETTEMILDKIDAEVNLFIGDFPMSDDITLVALKRDRQTK
jgi:serine phosphatase RsbU (regulator of sigma subunit)/putative methionine-R-sulfoxide reductase with GAF domain/anti-sigma regulatory factor (Ser/Thr protein kinase)